MLKKKPYNRIWTTKNLELVNLGAVSQKMFNNHQVEASGRVRLTS